MIHKLNNQQLQVMLDAANVCKLAKIDACVIEKEIIRAQSDDHVITILEHTDDYNFPFDGIALSRIDILLTRYNLVSADKSKGATTECTVDVNNNNVPRKIIFTSKQATVEHRCASVELVGKNLPKKLRVPQACIIGIPNKKIVLATNLGRLLQSASSAMQSSTTCFRYDEHNISIEIVDINGDTFTQQLPGKVQFYDKEHDQHFAYRFSTDALIRALVNSDQPNDASIFGFLTNGMLYTSINQLSTYIAMAI